MVYTKNERGDRVRYLVYLTSILHTDVIGFEIRVNSVVDTKSDEEQMDNECEKIDRKPREVRPLYYTMGCFENY